MTIRISSVVLYGDSQPDSGKLLSKGWGHPLGIHDEPLERSLVKSFGNLRFQVVRHDHLSSRAQYPTYTEIYVSHVSDDEDKPILKGHGTPFSISELFASIVWLEEEFE
jgi:hypothetical protein